MTSGTDNNPLPRGGKQQPAELSEPKAGALLEKDDSTIAQSCSSSLSTANRLNSLAIPSLKDARNAHFWRVAFPGIRSIVLAFMFIFFGIIQSARAYTVLGSVFGAFIFSVAGVAFWVGWQGISEAYESVKENFPEPTQPKLESPDLDMDGILAIITANRVVDDSYVEYRVDVSVSGEHWFVWRRYSDFYQTFQVESDFAVRMAKAQFPPKRWFGHHLSSAFIEERTSLLNKYLFDLLKEHGVRRVDAATAQFFVM